MWGRDEGGGCGEEMRVEDVGRDEGGGCGKR